jgi:hypothetical protein
MTMTNAKSNISQSRIAPLAPPFDCAIMPPLGSCFSALPTSSKMLRLLAISPVSSP